MKYFFQRLVTVNVIAFALQSQVAPGQTGLADVKAPPVPPNLYVPAGNAAYWKGHAIGTQNYVCLPSANGSASKFLGPQATISAVHHRLLLLSAQ